MANNKQVVIAGAGPAGCVAALVLSRAGVSVQVLEAEPDVVLDMRASTFHPPTLDMLDELEVTDKLIAQGQVRLANLDQEVPPEALARFLGSSDVAPAR